MDFGCNFAVVDVPTFSELTARNTAVTDLYVSGSLQVSADTDTGRVNDNFVFWHGHGDRWWVERNGVAVYASSSSTDTVAVARVGEFMVHQRRGGLIRLGRSFVPRDLFGPRSLLARRTRVQHGARRPKAFQHNGRPAWSVEVTSSTATTVMVFDEETAIIVELSSPDHDNSLRLVDMEVHTDLPASRFVWDGHAVEAGESPTIGMS